MPNDSSLDRLSHALEATDQPHHVWQVGDGRLLVLPFGARIVACDIPAANLGENDSLFWYPPALEDTAKTADMVKQGGVTGGDRLWIGPEVGYFFTDLEKARVEPFKNVKLPTQVDPGDFVTTEDQPGHIELVNEAAMRDYRTGKSMRLRMARRFDVIDALPDLPASVKSASFAITNTLTSLEADKGAVACCWDVLMVPAGGTLVCPTFGKVDAPRNYYEPYDERHLTSDDQAVRFRIDANRQMKVGLGPTQTTGRMAYHRVLGDQATLIFRSFLPQPGRPYIDVPRASDDFFGGDALQTYSDNGGFGLFGEMEYQDPALVGGQSPETISSTCITHVLVGPKADIDAMGAKLLGVPLER